MYPHQHAIISFVGTALYAALQRVDPMMFVAWVVLGTVAGVLIDIDHALIPLFMESKRRYVLEWAKKPWEVLQEPRRYLEDVHFESFGYLRLVTHVILIVTAYEFTYITPYAEPVLFAMLLHLTCDIAADMYTGQYGFIRALGWQNDERSLD